MHEAALGAGSGGHSAAADQEAWEARCQLSEPADHSRSARESAQTARV